jgi:hypothetical protein
MALHEWAIRTLAYSGISFLLSMAIYWLWPWLVRHIAASFLKGLGDVVLADIKTRSQGLLRKGREQALAGPQKTIIGHLVEPYLERLAGWFLDKINEHPHEHLSERYAEACIVRLRRYRWTTALAVTQVIMALLVIGYILRGVL